MLTKANHRLSKKKQPINNTSNNNNTKATTTSLRTKRFHTRTKSPLSTPKLHINDHIPALHHATMINSSLRFSHTSSQYYNNHADDDDDDDDLAPVPQHTLAAQSNLSTSVVKAKLDQNKLKRQQQLKQAAALNGDDITSTQLPKQHSPSLQHLTYSDQLAQHDASPPTTPIQCNDLHHQMAHDPSIVSYNAMFPLSFHPPTTFSPPNHTPNPTFASTMTFTTPTLASNNTNTYNSTTQSSQHHHHHHHHTSISSPQLPSQLPLQPHQQHHLPQQPPITQFHQQQQQLSTPPPLTSYNNQAMGFYNPSSYGHPHFQHPHHNLYPQFQQPHLPQQPPQIHHRNIFHNVTSVPPPETFLQPPAPDTTNTTTHNEQLYDTYLHEDNSPLFTKPVRSVLLIKKWQSKQATLYSNHIADYLTQKGVQVFIEPTSMYDYEADYPTIFDLMHQVDIDTHKHLPLAFPTFQDTILASSTGSMVHRLHEQFGEEVISPETNSWSTSPKQIPPNNPENESARAKAASNSTHTTTTTTTPPLHPSSNTTTSTTTTTTPPSSSSQSSTRPRHHNKETPRYTPQITEALRQLGSQSFWKDFTRPEHLKPAFSPLEQRECIPFARKYEKWQEFIDVVIAVGGDGTLLHVSTLFGHQVPPVLGFSCGSFGFLMPFNPDRAEQAIDKMLKGTMRYQNRSRVFFKVQPTSQPQVFPINQYDPDCFHLLNEIVLKHSYTLNSSASVSDIECRVNGHLLARYQGDGLILASPTGSTAYSLAAGGSIIHPSINCLLITPIAPMTLSSRPVIVPSDSILTLSPVSTPVLLEGKYGRIVYPGETIVSTASKFPLPVFTRRNGTADFLQDLGTRMNYARMFRFKREDDDVNDQPQGRQGMFLSKRTESDHNGTVVTPPVSGHGEGETR